MDWISFIFGAFFVIAIEALIVITIVLRSFNSYMRTGVELKNEITDNKNSSNE